MPKAVDLTGKKFGKLTVLYKSGSNGPGTVWRCKCECGNVVDVQGYRLTQGNRRSCGCNWHTTKAEDLTGKRFGQLTVIRRAENQNGAHASWVCKCICGNECTVTSDHLKSGNTVSCGCVGAKALQPHKTHGMSGSRLYKVWRNMVQRCENPNVESYKYYGARGITVCRQWRDDYAAFYEWAMANGYDPNAKFGECTIDRIDVNGNYEPDNCRWADMKVQRHNQRVSCSGDE